MTSTATTKTVRPTKGMVKTWFALMADAGHQVDTVQHTYGGTDTREWTPGPREVNVRGGKVTLAGSLVSIDGSRIEVVEIDVTPNKGAVHLRERDADGTLVRDILYTER